MTCTPKTVTATRRPRRVAACAAAFAASVWPLVHLDFVAGYYWAAGEGRASFADLPVESTTRSTTGLAGNVAGLFSDFGVNVPRITNRGLLSEVQQTNSLRNGGGAGVVAGSPGVLPTNWSSVLPTGLSRELSAAGTDPATGLPRTRFRIFGTVSVTGGLVITMDGTTQIPASAGQEWTCSMYLALVAGSWPAGLTLVNRIRVGDGGGAGLSFDGQNISSLPATPQRYAYTRTMPASTGFIVPQIGSSNITAGTVVDFTIDIICVQLEQYGRASTPIPTTGTALTKSGDNVNLTLASALSGPFSVQVECDVDGVLDTVTRYILSISDGTTNNRLVISRTSSGQLGVFHAIGGVTGPGAYVTKTGQRRIKVAVAYDGASTWSVTADGVHLADFTSALPPGMVRIDLGNLLGGTQLGGPIRLFRLWRRALTASERLTLTA